MSTEPKESAGQKPKPIPPLKIEPVMATILLVEDDASVRNVVRQLLVRAGYRVLEAESEQEALWQWDKHWREIDLLFTDILIPHNTTGVKLAKYLRSRKTDLRVILTSGFSIEVAGHDVYESEDMFFLQKPFDSTMLLMKVRECLGEYNGQATADLARTTI